MERYLKRGVSAGKEDVHKAIANMPKGLFEHSFCKILPDIVANDADYCNIMHADTAGTKTSLAYLYWKETGKIDVWAGVVQDAMVMNLDDLGAVGAVDNILISSTIGRNAKLIPSDVLTEIIQSSQAFIERMADQGIQLVHTGGETADVGDIVRTVDIGFTTFARIKRKDLVVNNIQHGAAIVGLQSFGQATYENSYNSGIGSNGLTSARHDVLDKSYAEKYPESFDSKVPADVAYSGSKKLTDQMMVGSKSYDVGRLLLSPTRTYLPVLKRIFQELKPVIQGVIHCTGGAQTKVKKFIDKKHIIKDDLFSPPPLFELIQKESGTSWEEMYKVFNMGHRMEFYLEHKYAEELIAVANEFDIVAKIIGRVEDSKTNKISIKGPEGLLTY